MKQKLRKRNLKRKKEGIVQKLRMKEIKRNERKTKKGKVKKKK